MHLKDLAPLLGDAQVLPVVGTTFGPRGRIKRVEAYGSTQRLFTEAQRLALIARDGGCSFPGCTMPPAWCQAHHVRDHAADGPTTTDNGTLLCGHHHREFARLGYTCTMIDGRPHWTAPAWLDPTQTPTVNTAHTAGDECP